MARAAARAARHSASATAGASVCGVSAVGWDGQCKHKHMRLELAGSSTQGCAHKNGRTRLGAGPCWPGKAAPDPVLERRPHAARQSQLPLSAFDEKQYQSQKDTGNSDRINPIDPMLPDQSLPAADAMALEHLQR